MNVITAVERRTVLRYRFAVAALSIVAGTFYLYRLGKPSFWFDEAASFVNASLSWHEFGVAMHHRDVFFALYYALLHLWMNFGSDESTLRVPSVIGAVLALPCMFALGSRLFGNRAGLIAAILLAVNPLFVLHAREARPYAWLVLFAILSSWAFVRALDTGKPRDWAWYAAACVFGAYVHVFALLVPLSHGVSLAFIHGKRPWKAFFLSLCVVAAAVFPLLFLLLGQESTSGRAFAGHGNSRDLIYLFRIFCGSKASALLYAALGAGIYVRYRLQRSRALQVGDLAVGESRAYSYAFLFCCMLVPPCVTLVASHFVPLFLETYLLVALPPLLLLAAAAAALLGDARLVVLATLLFVSLNLPGALKTYGDHGEKEDWRGALAAVTARANAHDALLITPAADTASLAYYERNLVQRDLPTLVYPNESAYRLWLPAPALDMPRVEALVHRYARVWVIADMDAPESDAQARLFERMLANGFKRVQTMRFTRIVVNLYERAG